MKKKHFWALIIVVALLLVCAMLVPIILDRSWGDKGDLALTITSDRTNMTLKGTIIVTYTLTNVGTTKLRVLEPQNFILTHPKNLNNTSVGYRGPVPSIGPDPSDRNLFVLGPGKSRSYTDELRGHDWALEVNKTYKIVAGYSSKDVRGTFTLPYWKGELSSNEIIFTVVP
jgi:hypothetical protein